MFKPVKTGRMLVIAAMAVALFVGEASATVADKSATALWGNSSLPVFGQRSVAPLPTLETPVVNAPAPHGKGMMKSRVWCPGKKGKKATLHPAEQQAMMNNKPLFARLEALRQELKAIWRAPQFDQNAFLAKRAEIRSIKHQIGQNNDHAVITAAVDMTQAERAQITDCWFKKMTADKPCAACAKGKKGKMRKMHRSARPKASK